MTLDPEPDPAIATARTAAPGLTIENWQDTYTPTLSGKPLALEPYEFSRSVAIAPDGQRVLLGTEWALHLFDGRGQGLWENPVPGAAWAVNVSGDGRLAVAAFADGTIRWFRLEDGAELLAFFPHADRERWVVWTPQGYYMASPGAEDLIGWHVNRGLDEAPKWYTAARFRDQFHRPDVVTLVIDELDLDKALTRADREAGLKTIAPKLEQLLPPIIEIVEPADGTRLVSDPVIVTYIVNSPIGDPVPKITAQLNGQFLQAVAGPSDPIPAEGHAGRIYLSLAERLTAGEAQLSLIAENKNGASDAAVVRVHWGGAAPAVQRNKPRLFVLAIGVSHYRDFPHIDLEYAAQDARDFLSIMNRQEGGLYREVKLWPLIDEDALQSAIEDGFRWLRREVGEGDTAMLFFSGHGEREGLDYYFLPHDVDISSPIEISLTGIGHDRLRNSLRAVYDNGAKVLVFLDSCHSGAVAGDTKALPPDIDLVAAELASAENGVIVFTSSTGREVSKEDAAWENGAFTEALLQGFAGEADTARDGYISVSELQGFLPERVRKLTKRAQTPTIRVPFEKLFEARITVVH